MVLWKEAALKAYGLLGERDRRVEELEGLLRGRVEEAGSEG